MRGRAGYALLFAVVATTACTSIPKEVIGGPSIGPTSFFGPGPTSEAPPLLTAPAAIAAALKRGGYVIYVRHGRTRYEQAEVERNNRTNGVFDLAKCETQRQLSDFGRTELKFIGEQFRRAQIRLDRAYSSRYCRAIESAAYFVDKTEPTQKLSNEADVGFESREQAAHSGVLCRKASTRKAPFYDGARWHFLGSDEVRNSRGARGRA